MGLSRSEKVAQLVALGLTDDKLLKALLEYVRSARWNREEAIEELEKKAERADDWLLDAALNYAKTATKHAAA